MAGDALFAHIEKLQGPAPWGSVLDAGTGSHSLEWVSGLAAERWTAVTCDEHLARKLAKQFEPRMRPDDRVIQGDWRDPVFLHGEVSDVVLADYLLGALDGHAPYFQSRLFGRLRPHVGSRLYVVGLEPYPESSDDPWGKALLDVVRLRDACIILAGDRCYREYPLDWTVRALESSGFRVEDADVFPIRYGPRFVEEQLETARRKLPRIPDADLASRLGRSIDGLRERALEEHRLRGSRPFGADYVIHAQPV